LDSGVSSVQSLSSSSSTPCADACVSTDEFSNVNDKGIYLFYGVLWNNKNDE
jgi:hypothetical protein